MIHDGISYELGAQASQAAGVEIWSEVVIGPTVINYVVEDIPTKEPTIETLNSSPSVRSADDDRVSALAVDPGVSVSTNRTQPRTLGINTLGPSVQ